MQNGISTDPNNKNEEYIKVEMIIHKKGITQEDVLKFIKRCNVFGTGECGGHIDIKEFANNVFGTGEGGGHIDIKELAITGIESVDENTELDELMNAGLTGADLDEGQDIMAQKFFEKHPMWFVVTSCLKCGTPNIDFPCKRCGYE